MKKQKTKPKIKRRKLLFKQIKNCPNLHNTICNVYEDNNYFYYECPICGCVVGLQREGDTDEDVHIIGGELYKKKIKKEISFTGYNVNEIREIFDKRQIG